MPTEKREYIRVAMFEQYPQDAPTGYAVGLAFGANTRAGYADTFVSFEEAGNGTGEEIVTVAAKKLKAGIVAKLKQFNEKDPIIGREITLPEDEPENE